METVEEIFEKLSNEDKIKAWEHYTFYGDIFIEIIGNEYKVMEPNFVNYKEELANEKSKTNIKTQIM